MEAGSSNSISQAPEKANLGYISHCSRNECISLLLCGFLPSPYEAIRIQSQGLHPNDLIDLNHSLKATNLNTIVRLSLYPHITINTKTLEIKLLSEFRKTIPILMLTVLLGLVLLGSEGRIYSRLSPGLVDGHLYVGRPCSL
jgi:hypothetical protein